MKELYSIFKKEIKSYVDHPIAYVLAVVFLAINHFLFFRTSLLEEVASLRVMFQFLPWVFIFFISALTMRAWAEERREQTLNMLLSYPVAVWQIILGKFLATLAFVAAIMAVTLTVPWGLASAGSLDWGVVFSQYLGALFLSVAAIGVGQWSSSLTKNQVVAFIISIAVLFGFFMVGLDFVILAVPYPLNVVFQQLGMLSHYNAMTRGVFDVRDVFYFLSVGFVFLALSYAWLMRLKMPRKSKQVQTLKSAVALMIIIAVFVNLFGQRFTVRADLTSQNIYSLSSATKQILRDLDDTVRFTLYRSKKLPTQVELVSRDLQDILRDYQKFGGRHVSLTIKYPDTDEKILEEANRKGIPTVRFNVLKQDEFTLQEGNFGLAIEYLDKRETLPLIQNIDDIEYRLTRAIQVLKSSEKPKIGYVSDFGGKALDAEWKGAIDQFREAFLIEQIKLSKPDPKEKPDKIDESIDVLLVAAPTQKFSDVAIKELEAYIARGGKILWFVSGITVDQARLSVAANETGLEKILEKEGISLQKDLAADLASHETVNFSTGVFTYFLPYPFWVKAGLSRHVLAGNVTQAMLPWPSSLRIDEKFSDRVKPLISTTEQGVHQTSNFQISPDAKVDYNAMEKSTLTLAAVAEGVKSEKEGVDGRWVVIANNDFLSSSVIEQHPYNLTLAYNALDWLTQNEALVAIRSKNAKPATLIWQSKGQQAWVKWGNIVGIPVLVAFGGAFWLYRRRKKIAGV